MGLQLLPTGYIQHARIRGQIRILFPGPRHAFFWMFSYTKLIT